MIKGFFFTGTKAGFTVNAFLFVKRYLPGTFYSFRIMTPYTGQGAAFEKYGCAYAGTVIKRVSFNFEY